MDIIIRAELPADAGAVRTLLIDCFGGEDEARLVEDLRQGGHVVVSVVASREGAVIGHVLFSDLGAEIGGLSVPAVALAPLAVRADSRQNGVGARLVEAGLRRCRDAGRDLAVVLGDPAYYARFGFSAEAAKGLSCAFSGPALQALALQPGVLGSGNGELNYAPPFAHFE